MSQFYKIIHALIMGGLFMLGPGCYGKTELPACETQLSSSMCVKIGQMLIVGFGGFWQEEKTGRVIWDDQNNIIFTKQANIAKSIVHHVGGVILYAQAYRDKITHQVRRDRNIQDPLQLEKLNHDLQAYAAKVQSPAELPLIIAVDQEGGLVDRLPSALGFYQNQTTFCPSALGDNEALHLGNPEKRSLALQQTYQYAGQMADELVANHFNLNFAPTVDVNINPLNPIIGAKSRSFSTNPEIVADQAWQFVQAFLAKGLVPVLKHFPGHGSSTGDSHNGLVDVTKTYEANKELAPYRILIGKGYDSPIMTTHVINGQIDKSQCKEGAVNDYSTVCPGTLSYKTLTGKLRGELNFKGVIISDDLTMGGIVQYYAPLDFNQALPLILEKAINAGVDMFIVANNNNDYTQQIIDTIAQLVKEGRVPSSQVEAAYQRIMALKQKMKYLKTRP